MSERIDQWPRVHTCLHDWCPKKSDECDRCDAVLGIIVRASAQYRAEVDRVNRSTDREISGAMPHPNQTEPK